MADPVNDVFHLIPDTKMDVDITTAFENETVTVIEGSKKIDNCDDKVEDIGLAPPSSHCTQMFRLTLHHSNNSRRREGRLGEGDTHKRM